MLFVPNPSLAVFADYLAVRREAILEAWTHCVEADAGMTTVSALSRVQFRNHIPEVLDAFQAKLRGTASKPPGSADSATAEATSDEDRNLAHQEAVHGLHRWQQGYRLRELIQEWGHLQICLVEELDRWVTTQPALGAEAATTARRELALLITTAIGESVDEYARVDREEAAGHARDLQRALVEVNELDRRRMELFRQTAHDLHGNVNAVNLSTLLLDARGLSEEERAEYVGLLQRGLEAMRSTLGELMDLARLEAGQERRQVKAFDAGRLLLTLGKGLQSFVRQRGLLLETSGPKELPVEGDAAKVQRIAQNLLLNAIKYTERGKVTLRWEQKDSGHWQLSVRDTGPGMNTGPGAPITSTIHEATVNARQAQGRAGTGPGAESAGPPPEPAATKQPPGEGIGLSIVKRLCELLDASLELESGASGTTFVVLFPCRYAEDATVPLPR